MALILELTAQGKNPFDFLDISVKKDMDVVLADSKNVATSEAILPKKDFLCTLQDVKASLSVDAKAFTKYYLDEALKPRVILGTKGKA
jgi:hypothetical protein